MKVKRGNTEFNVSDSTILKGEFGQKYIKWQSYTFDVLDLYLGEDDIFVDIGAHIGMVLLYYAGKVKHSIGVDPDPTAFKSLKANVECNDFKDKVDLLEAAIYSDDKGITVGPGKRKAAWGGSGIAIVNDNEVGKKVESLTLSQLFDRYNLNKNIFTKIDIEGGERFLDFSDARLARLYIEIHPHLMSTSELIKTLKSLFLEFSYIQDVGGNQLWKEATINNFLISKAMAEAGTTSTHLKSYDLMCIKQV